MWLGLLRRHTCIGQGLLADLKFGSLTLAKKVNTLTIEVAEFVICFLHSRDILWSCQL